jgi:putative lipoprotein
MVSLCDRVGRAILLLTRVILPVTDRQSRRRASMMRQAFFLIPLLAALAACETVPPKEVATVAPAPNAQVTLAGTATYRQRIALPADARLTVRISDVGRMDAPAPVIAETEIATEGRQVPLAFSLAYDPARIDTRGRYSVSARITDGAGRLIWITDTHADLPPPGQTIELRLVQVTG